MAQQDALPAYKAPLASSFDLLHAIESDQLVLHYQPVIDLRSGLIDTREALVRWQHPVLGLLGPNRFLSLAQNRWLGCRLTDWVVGQAFADCARWRAGGDEAGVSVNVLPELLNEDWLLGMLTRQLEDHELPPESVTLEVTECRWPADATASYRVLNAVAALGVRISLDDFGTGDSSLSRLHQVRFHELKIDRSFVSEATEHDAARQIVAFTCGLARALGARAVAEGVEREADLRLVEDLAVDAVQGYLIGVPAPIA